MDVASIYIRDVRIVNKDLLTFEEEQELAKKIEEGRVANGKIVKLGRLLLPKQKKELDYTVHQGKKAWVKLIELNLRLVVHMANRFKNQGLPFSDLIQEGNLGLITAVDHFEWRKGTKFSTYASWWIMQRMQRAIATDVYDIRLPVYIYDLRRRIFKTISNYKKKFGYNPSTSELSDIYNIKQEMIEFILWLKPDALSLEQPINKDEPDGNWLVDLIASPGETPEELALNKIVKELLADELEKLPYREKIILEFRFGFYDGENHTLESLARHFKLSREGIRQIQIRALERLRMREEFLRQKIGYQ